MTNKKFKIPCMIFRGGTSKGLYFLKQDLPIDMTVQEKFLLSVMGSPDINQIDGLGGGKSVTSKVAIIEKSDREDADVNYTFCQISVDKELISRAGNCGNISSGVGPFAIEKGLVEGKDPITSVRIYNTNTKKIIIEEVPCRGGMVQYDGDYAIAGVPGTASPMKMRFTEPAGTLRTKSGQKRSLLPTGNAVDMMDVPGIGKIPVSIVDATNTLVFVNAADLGLRGDELPEEIDKNPRLLELIENIRGMAAVKLGLCSDYQESEWETPGIPKMTIVSESCDYQTIHGKRINKAEIDITARMMSMQKTHPSYAMTGAMCTAAAAVIPGTIVYDLTQSNFNPQCIRIGHPGGILEGGVNYEIDGNGSVFVKDTFGYRTANLLMEGFAYA